jgi:hypothetical protein
VACSSCPGTPLETALAFTRAVVVHAATGMRTVGERAYRRRLATCGDCEHFEAEKTKCGVCGCRLKVKARWAEQRCPLAKW